MKILLFFLFFVLSKVCIAWDKEDYSIFDLHDKLAKTHANGSTPSFYAVLEVDKNATPIQISRAYRRLSMELHPDKNKDKKANEIYALLTSINAVLKDKDMRSRYDNHLKRGIPTWRGTGYFIARYKPSLTFILTFVILAISVSQYLIQYTLYAIAKARLLNPTTTSTDETNPKKTSNDLTYTHLRRMLKKAGITDPPASVKKAIRSGTAVAEILEYPELKGIITDRLQQEEFVQDERVLEEKVDELKPQIGKTLIVALPRAVFVGVPLWIAGKIGLVKGAVDDAKKGRKANGKKSLGQGLFENEHHDNIDNHDDTNVDDDGERFEDNDNDDVRHGKSGAEKALKNRKRTSKRQQQVHGQQQQQQPQPQEQEKPKKKKVLDKNLLKSSTGVVLNKADLIRKIQEEQKKAQKVD